MVQKTRLIPSSLLIFLFFVLGSFQSGCSTTPDPETGDTSVLSSTDEHIFVGDAIEMNYDPNVIMKRAESFFEKESYPEAIVEYQHFLDLHRPHMLAPYAQYKLALSHFKMFTTADRDPEPVMEAKKAFEELLVAFPENRYKQEATDKIQECQKLLAEHHLFVGKFYYNKQAYLAAARRFEKMLEYDPHSDMAAEAKYQLAVAYQQLGLPEWSRDWLLALVEDHSSHQRRRDGLKLLATLQKEHPDMVVALNQPEFQQEPRFPSVNGSPPWTLQPQFNGSPVPQSPSLAPQPRVVASSIPHTTDCPLGSWCETRQVSLGQPANRPPAPPVTTCQPGVWC